jgi:hypothetical protein
MHASGSTVDAPGTDDGELGCGGGDTDGGGGHAVGGSRSIPGTAVACGDPISVAGAAAVGSAPISLPGIAAVPPPPITLAYAVEATAGGPTRLPNAGVLEVWREVLFFSFKMGHCFGRLVMTVNFKLNFRLGM